MKHKKMDEIPTPKINQSQKKIRISDFPPHTQRCFIYPNNGFFVLSHDVFINKKNTKIRAPSILSKKQLVQLFHHSSCSIFPAAAMASFAESRTSNRRRLLRDIVGTLLLAGLSSLPIFASFVPALL